MAIKIKCFNVDCEHNDPDRETCENPDGAVIGSSGICCAVRSQEEQDEENTPDTTEEPEEGKE